MREKLGSTASAMCDCASGKSELPNDLEKPSLTEPSKEALHEQPIQEEDPAAHQGLENPSSHEQASAVFIRVREKLGSTASAMCDCASVKSELSNDLEKPSLTEPLKEALHEQPIQEEDPAAHEELVNPSSHEQASSS